MKNILLFRKLSWLLILFYGLTSWGQTDDFTDGDFTTNPVWSGDTGSFSISTNTSFPSGNASTDGSFLMSNASSGNATLTTPSTEVSEWKFSWGSGNWNPSTGNYLGVILMANQSGSITANGWTGYFLKVGSGATNDTDKIELWKKNGGTGAGTKVGDFPSSPTVGGGQLENGLNIRITRSSSGVFTLYYSSGFTYSSTPTTSAGTLTDNTVTTSSFFGVYQVFANQSAARRSYLDNLVIGNNSAPTATSVSFSGADLLVGTQLTGSYTYSDANSDPQGSSTFKWYRANDNSGTGSVAIAGATSLTYTLTNDDLGKYIRFGVVPVASAGTTTGTEAFSAWNGPITSTSPFITASGTLAALTTTYGTASTTTSFTVNAGNLTNDLIITAPAGFHVSENASSGFASSINLGNGSQTGKVIYVSLPATTAAGSYNGTISLQSGETTTTVATANSTVNKKELTITGLSTLGKIYDGNLSVTVNGTATYSGLVNGEETVYTSATGTVTWAFPNKTQGTNKTLTRTGNYDVPSNNYTVTQPTLTATISKKDLNITGATAQNKVYNANTTATIIGATPSLTDLVSGDVVSVSGGGTFASANVADNISVTAALTLGGTDAGNYTIIQPTGLTANITKANQEITGFTDIVKTINDLDFNLPALTVQGLTVSYQSSNASVASVSGNTVAIENIGTTIITATQAGDNNHNALVTTSITLTVNEAPVALALWDFTGEDQLATSTADILNTNLATGSGVLTRGSGAIASQAANSFRTTGFQNDGIATTNTDYFQTSFSSGEKILSFATIDAYLSGTSTFTASPGVTTQFAYSFDNVNYTLITPSQTRIGNGAMTQVNLNGVSALQNIPAGTTVYFRFYASGRTTTGGFGFNSTASGAYGLQFYGKIINPVVPVLSVSTESLTDLNYTAGNGPSAAQSFVVSGENLTGNVTVLADGVKFEISENETSGYTDEITLTAYDGTDKTIWVRSKAGQSIGAKNEIVLISGGGATLDKEVLLNGEVLAPPVSITSPSCGSILNYRNAPISCNSVSVEGHTVQYRFRIVRSGDNFTASILRDVPNFTILQASYAAYVHPAAATYSVYVSLVVDGEQQPETEVACSISVPAVALPTQGLQNCDTVLTTPSTLVFGPSVSGAVEYQFEISLGGNVVTTLTRPSNYFHSSTNFTEWNYGTTYTVKMKARKSNETFDQLAFGTACNLTYPAIPAQTQALVNCSNTLSTVSTLVFTPSVFGATSYRFELNDGSTTYTVTRPNAYFHFTTDFPEWNYGKTYSVKVQVARNNNEDYGPLSTNACTLTSPAMPTPAQGLVNCATVMTSPNSLLFAPSVFGATNYQFVVTIPGTYYAQFEKNVPYFRLSDVEGWIAGTTYNVTVKAFRNGVESGTSTSCSFTTPGTTPVARIAQVPFAVKAYPNPYSNAFQLDVTSTDKTASIDVKVFDMLGRMVDSKNTTAGDLETATIGSDYPSGVYNVIVTQGEQTKVVRVVKR